MHRGGTEMKLHIVVVGLGLTVAAGAQAEDSAWRRLSVPEYRDRMKAGWIGQIAGVAWEIGRASCRERV